MRRRLNLALDRRGSTLIEFAIVAPVMMIMMMGLSDLAYQVYTQTIVNGEMQKAGRDSGIQGGGSKAAAIDAKVSNMVKKVAPKATFVFTRKNYDTFSTAKPEPFSDTNNNGVRDAGECYWDINANSQWDSEPGADGQGGANDVTRYSVEIVYPRLFPVKMFGWSATNTIKASTLLRNQPYATQQVAAAPKQICR